MLDPNTLPSIDDFDAEVDPETGEPLPAQPQEAPDPYADKARMLEVFKKCKEESMEHRWIWEREWLRDLYYISGRQWITFHQHKREWIDKRLQKWIPRPVTNKMAETVQAIRSVFSGINLVAKARPLGSSTSSIATAEIADQMMPCIHEEHDMGQVMREQDFWLIGTGSSLLQVSWDLDQRSNRTFIQHEQCVTCQYTANPKEVEDGQGICPQCAEQSAMFGMPPVPGQWQPAVDEKGKKIGEWIAFGKGKTTALSPFEYAFPHTCTRFDELPYIIRLRWREKGWFEANAPMLVPSISWEKTSSDRSLQLFKSLATSNESGPMGSPLSTGAGGQQADGVTEYELWYKPTPEYPEGLVLRVIGDKDPIILEVPGEGLPGPIPYKDIDGGAIFPFVFCQYEHVGGRLYGRSAVSPLIQKQDQLNQLDSLIQLIVQRMSNPAWVIPEGAGVENLTGEPGLVIKWQPLGAASNAKPERIDGADVPSSLYQLRQQYVQDIEELSGAFDIIKGQKPSGVEAFSALQLLVERSQSRFTSVFAGRGELYRRWASIALELERQFGPDQRTWSIVSPNKGYTFQYFENAQLQGAIEMQIEDGSSMPKTSLGKRAAIEQSSQLGLLDPADPDQRYALLSHFGLSDLVPTLNFHVQAALQIQDAFEKWVKNPQGLPPLVVKPWHDVTIHWVERIKWLNTDKMRELMATDPMIEQMVTQHLGELQFNMMATMQQQPGAPGDPNSAAGGAQAMANSNQESGATDTVPSGNNSFGGQVQGPS